MYYNYAEMYDERPFAICRKVLHPSHLSPNPNSLLDLKINRKNQEERAYICFGVGRNSLGLSLMLPKSKSYLGKALERARVRYTIVEDK